MPTARSCCTPCCAMRWRRCCPTPAPWPRATAAPAAADPVAAARDPAFQAVLLDVLALTLAEPEAGAPAPLPHGALQSFVAGRLKRLRYLAEFARPLWRAKAVDRFVNALKPMQDALGAHNDTVTAAQKFRD